MPSPITDTQRQHILTLHKQGLSRNEIARQAKVSQSTVSKICAEDGLTFDRSKTINATRARVADNKARRAVIVQRLYGRTEKILDRLEQDTYTWTATTKDGTEVVMDSEPPAEAERHHATAIGIYLDKAAKLEDYDKSPADGVAGAASVVDKLMDGFTRIYEAGQ